jgi:hypothetical protein
MPAAGLFATVYSYPQRDATASSEYVQEAWTTRISSFGVQRFIA